MKTVKAKVAKVLDEERVAINLGQSSGVVVGDSVVLFEMVDIPDPDDSTELLGTVKLDRVRLRIETVDQYFSVARVPYVSPQLNQLVLGAKSKPAVRLTESKSLSGVDNWVFTAAGEPVDVYASQLEDETER